MDNPDITFVGIAGRDDEDAMRNFVSTTGVGAFPHVNDTDGTIWREYEVTYQPAFVFVRADGSSETFGSLDLSDIQSKIDELF
jgi:hypothetical protein